MIGGGSFFKNINNEKNSILYILPRRDDLS